VSTHNPGNASLRPSSDQAPVRQNPSNKTDVIHPLKGRKLLGGKHKELMITPSPRDLLAPQECR